MKKKIIELIILNLFIGVIILGFIIYNSYNKQNFKKDYKLFALDINNLPSFEKFKIGESINLNIYIEEIKGVLLSNTIIYSINDKEIFIIVPGYSIKLLNILKKVQNLKFSITKSNISNDNINIKINQTLKKELEDYIINKKGLK